MRLLRLRIQRGRRLLRALRRVRRVHFVVAGVQKGGTSALHYYLRHHPDLCLAERKEVHFFDSEYLLFRLPMLGRLWYHSYFDPPTNACLLGEATPAYLYWPPAAARMRRYNPNLKIIILLRNPIERAFSHWQMERGRGKENLDFAAALAAESERLAGGREQQLRYSYVDRGRYSGQLARLWHYFPRQQTLILKSEQLAATPLPVLNQVTDFLGIKPFQRAPAWRVHTQAYDRPMAAAVHERLRREFAAEIETLEEILGWDCRDWLAYPGQSAPS